MPVFYSWLQFYCSVCERGDKVGEVSFQRHRLNTNNGRRRRLLFDLDVCWLRDAQSLPYRAGARVAMTLR